MRRPLAMRALCAALLLGLPACDPATVDPMKSQPRYDPYEESPLFDDGRAMRPPVPGTVAREQPRGPTPLTTGRQADGTDLAQLPMPVDRAALERGRHHFNVVCATCHGVVGDGNSVVARKMSLRPPPSLHQIQRTPGFIFRALTDGYGFMPSYAHYLSPEERWETIAYLEALRLSQSARPEQLPDDVRQRLEKER